MGRRFILIAILCIFRIRIFVVLIVGISRTKNVLRVPYCALLGTETRTCDKLYAPINERSERRKRDEAEGGDDNNGDKVHVIIVSSDANDCCGCVCRRAQSRLASKLKLLFLAERGEHASALQRRT